MIWWSCEKNHPEIPWKFHTETHRMVWKGRCFFSNVMAHHGVVKISLENFGKLLTGWVVNKRYFSTSELCSANGKLVIWIPGIPFWKGLVPRSTPIRIPNHRAPNHQFTLSWCVCVCVNVREGFRPFGLIQAKSLATEFACSSLDIFKVPYDIGGAKKPGMVYFLIKRGAKEPQNPQNHRVLKVKGCNFRS